MTSNCDKPLKDHSDSETAPQVTALSDARDKSVPTSPMFLESWTLALQSLSGTTPSDLLDAMEQRSASESRKSAGPPSALPLPNAGAPTGMAQEVSRASSLIRDADALIITAGAGIGIDAGLPDFRGANGFWNAYPALGRAGIQFEEIANPRAFIESPRLVWGFYGHRLNLYRTTEPHNGFRILQAIAERMPHGAFVFTSNVDGQFQKAGFSDERIVECHGSVHYLQCIDGCDDYVWPASGLKPVIDELEGAMTSRLPTCPVCRKLARPNILMFNDPYWIGNETYEQMAGFRTWRDGVDRPVVIEIGAGTAIPSVRRFGEDQGCPLIRINPSEPEVARSDDVSLALGALEALTLIARVLDRRSDGD